MSTEEPDQDPEDDEDLRYFVRIGQTDLDGTKTLERALLELSGVGRRTVRIVAEKADVSVHETFGRLDDEKIDEIVDIIEEYSETVPDWLTNRQNDFYTGEATHLTGNDVELTRQQDINRMQKIGSYKGIRHQRGQKVRGQRTKSTGRTEGTVGVNVEEIQEEAAEEEDEV